MERTINIEQFNSYSELFVKISDKLGDGWSLNRFKDDSDCVFVSKHTEIMIKSYENSVYNNLEDSEPEEHSFHDDSTVISSRCQDSMQCASVEYQVLYSCSYCVPVLYCRMWNSSGVSVPLEQVWKMAPPACRGWTQLTLVPHPVTDTPWLHIHPCKTANIMGEILALPNTVKSENYLVTFLSIYGPAVGIHLSEKYTTEIHTDTKKL